MNLFYWNIRGAGNSASQNMLKHHLLMSRPNLVAIAEPKVLFSTFPTNFWRNTGLSLVSCNQRQQGVPNLWVLADSSCQNISIFLSTEQVIVIHCTFLGILLQVGFVHAHSDYGPRRRLWEDLLALPDLPTALVGDFNAVLGAHERSNGSPPPRTGTADFSDFIQNGDFIEPASTGCYFTWSNRRFTQGYLETRIDRVLISHSFLDTWHSVSYHMGIRNCSDHCPLFLRCLLQLGNSVDRKSTRLNSSHAQ